MPNPGIGMLIGRSKRSHRRAMVGSTNAMARNVHYTATAPWVKMRTTHKLPQRIVKTMPMHELPDGTTSLKTQDERALPCP